MFFGPQRMAFLEFLRNLSPQIMLLTIALVASSNLDMTHVSWTRDGFKNAWPTAAIILVFCWAALANVAQFLDKISEFTDEQKAMLEEVRLKHSGRYFRMFFAQMGVLFQRHPVLVVRYCAAVLVVEIGMAALFIAAIPAATSVVNAIHPHQVATANSCAALSAGRGVAASSAHGN